MSRPERPSWLTAEPGRLIGRGHAAGDFLEAYDWTVVERSRDTLIVDAHLPAHATNPRGQLFGGFTGAYVDLVALHTVRQELATDEVPFPWLATLNMRIDYFAPVNGNVRIESRVIRRLNRTYFIETRFRDVEKDELLVSALTTIRATP